MIKNALLVGAGGFAGSVLRYLVSSVMIGSSASFFMPWGTFAVNASGSLLIGVLLAACQGNWYFLLIAGFCGGYTTFSAFSAELFNMVRAGNTTQAVIYIVSSVAVCVAAVWAGMALAGKIKP